MIAHVLSLLISLSSAQAAQNPECTSTEKIPQLYAKEFELKQSETKNVQLKYLTGKPKLVSAAHPDHCGADGCESALYLISDKECAKQVLLYKGSLTPQGKFPAINEKLEITKHRQAIDNSRESKMIYQFDEHDQSYHEVK